MTAAPPLAGVLGWPIGHSRSPRLHGHWLARYGLPGHYVALGVRPDDFDEAFGALPKLGFRGVNVTIPFKEAALARAADASERARSIGAANTVTFHDGAAFADNTDGHGFLENLRQGAPGWSAAAGPALVMGAGGASRAVVWALLADGAPEVRHRKPHARPHRGAARPLRRARPRGALEPRGRGGRRRHDDREHHLTRDDGRARPAPRLDAAPRAALVTDIVYRPLVTPLLRQAQARGLATVDGLGMLLHQAAPGFEAWFGQRPEVDADLRAAVLTP
jgi:shikimate dehydrogenase